MKLHIQKNGKLTLEWNEKKLLSASYVGLLVIDGKTLKPTRAEQTGGKVSLYFAGGLCVHLLLEKKSGYFKFTLLDAPEKADVFLFGPYLMPKAHEYGEVIGAAWRKENLVCLQALTPKVEGGYPREISDIPVPSPLPDAPLTVRPDQCAALPCEEGVSLQLFARDRVRRTVRPYLNEEFSIVEPVEGPDGRLEGASIALFACHKEDLLERIEQIELAEQLPHPVIDGQWVKTSPRSMESYLITNFSRDNIEQALDYAQAGGFTCLYHEDPFENWGHFELKKQYFPNGDEDLRYCAERAALRGITLGTHALSNFITTNDPYVTPCPDKRLLVRTETTLARDVTAEDTEIEVSEPEKFASESFLQCIRIGDELIRFGEVRERKLTACVRGAFGTHSGAHRAGSSVKRLWDHGYMTLFPNLELQDEMAHRLGTLMGACGVKRFSFDGLEGCEYTGHGDYACARFVGDCCKLWGDDVLCDASRLNHYRWHLHAYMNWGEPWYDDMRNGQTDLRVSNQAFYRRNFFPRMMGWYSLRLHSRRFPATFDDDVEWMLARAMGFQAGFAFSAEMERMHGNGRTEELFRIIKRWEEKRMRGDQVDEGLLKEMRDTNGDFHLLPDGRLTRTKILHFVCDTDGAQPGLPAGADWSFKNPYGAQPLHFKLQCGDYRDHGDMQDITLAIEERIVHIPVHMKAGEFLLYTGGDAFIHTDINLNTLNTYPLGGETLMLPDKQACISFKALFSGEEKPYPEMRIFLYDMNI